TPNDNGAMWLPGETFVDATNEISIAVNSATATGYNVTITNKTTGTLTVQRSGLGRVTSLPAAIDCPATSCSGTWQKGTAVTLSALADSGQTLVGFTGCDSTSGTTCTVNVRGDRTVTATFVPNVYTLSVNTTSNGYVSSTPNGIACGTSCVATFARATSVTLTAEPRPGVTSAHFSGCDTVSDFSCTVAMNANRNVAVT